MFNLVSDPWVQVTKKGTFETVSLGRLFEDAHQIDGIEGTALERIAVIRLALCVAQAALDGPATERDWSSCKKTIQPKVAAYLKKWIRSFDLYEKFLQTPWVSCPNNKCIDDLFLGRSRGNRHTLFDHDARGPWRKPSDAELAMGLLATQMFSVGGLIQAPTHKWCGKQRKKVLSAQASALVNSLITVLSGDTLLDTLHLNMIPKEWLKDEKIGFGTPIWEYGEIRHEDGAKIHRTYLGNLVPLSRGIMLHEGSQDMVMVDGFKSAQYPIYRDPMASLRKKIVPKKSPYLPALINKAAWRDLEAILKVGEGRGIDRGVWAFRHFSRKPGSHKPFSVLVGALSCDKKNAAKVEATLDWSYQVGAGMLDDAGLSSYIAFVKDAEEGFSAVRTALWRCLNKHRNGKSPKKDAIQDGMVYRSMNNYWPQMDAYANQVIDAVNAGKPIDWEKKVRATAWATYKEVCPKVSIEAYSLGMATLERRLSV